MTPVAPIMRAGRGASIRSEIAALGIAIAAIILFIGTAGKVVPAALHSLLGFGTAGADHSSAATLVLNIALVIFSWRRYADLRHEVVERTAAEERILFLASRDSLTKLRNRQSLGEDGARMMAEVEASGGSAGFCVIDLDRFKHINDVYGHAAGDRLLCLVSDMIAGMVSDRALCARLGGDEFAVVIPCDDASAEEPLTYFAEQFVAQLQQPIDLDGVEVHVSASIGLSQAVSGCTTVEGLLRRADIALTASKKSGRSQAVWFDDSMESELRARSEIEEGLRRGIPLGQFVPYYQQQVDLATGRIRGFEVLARWKHPALGIVDPDIFIPVAEETGQIGDLSDSVIHQAFEEAKHWDASLTLAINISPLQLKDAWLAQKIVKLLTETGFPAERLEIEITESSLFENLSLAQNIVASLKNQGIRLSLDDFGTGYSSLAHLRALPFDCIKIDRSFVQSMNRDQESWAIVNAITKLGESLGLPVTAEGIEDAITRDKLASIGCDLGQGYHFGRPVPGVEVHDLLARHELLAAPSNVPARKSDDHDYTSDRSAA